MTPDNVARWWGFAPERSITSQVEGVSAAIWRFERGGAYELEGRADDDTDVIAMPLYTTTLTSVTGVRNGQGRISPSIEHGGGRRKAAGDIRLRSGVHVSACLCAARHDRRRRRRNRRR